MLSHSIYENDNRVRRYAEALAKRGDLVEVFALGKDSDRLGEVEISGVRVIRIQHRQHDERSKWTYAWRLLRFLVTSSVRITRRHYESRYDLVHVHNIPDFLVFAAWYPKCTGAKLILDIHDIVPELFAAKFGTRVADLYVWFLKKIEKVSAAFVDHVIVSNHLWYEKLIARSVPEAKCSVVLNHVDPAIFYRHVRTRRDDRLVMVFPGGFQPHQGLDVALNALAQLTDRVPNAELHLYGGGGGADGKERLVRLVAQLGLNERVKFFDPVPLDEVPTVIADADVGIVPKRADSFGNEAYSTKIMEFMSQGIPAVVSRTKIDEFYFNDRVVRFFPSGDSKAMADAMLEVIENRALRNSLVEAGFEYVESNCWNLKRSEYLNLVDSLSTETFDELE